METIKALLSPQSPLAYLLVILLPSLPSLLARYRRWRSPPPTRTSLAPSPPRPLHLYLLLAIHTLYRLKQLIQPPFNVFHQYRLPLAAGRDILQLAFVRYFSTIYSGIHRPADLPHSIQRLISRLSNVDYRILYARYGHTVMEDCSWCSTYDDFAMAAMPGILAPYVGMTVLLGMLGWGPVGGKGAPGRAARLRSTAGWMLGISGAVEVGVRYMWDMRLVEGDCIQLDETCTFLRTLLLLSAPLIYTILPLSPAPADRMLEYLPALQSTSNVVRLTALARSSIAADPTLRAQWSTMGKQAEGERSIARRDEWVGQAADRQGLGMGDGSLVWQQAKGWVGEQWRGMVSVQTGPPPAPPPSAPRRTDSKQG